MDLGGPKLRTGEISLAPPVLKWKPKRSEQGRILAPARIWIHQENDTSACPVSADALLAVEREWLDQAMSGDKIVFTDARGSHRELQLLKKVNNGFWAESEKTAYLTLGTKLHLLRTSLPDVSQQIGQHCEVKDLPQVPETIRLYRGSTLVLTKNQSPGTPEEYNEYGQISRAARIPCSLPEVFDAVIPGERILFDDGRITGIIKSVHSDEITVEITHARDGGEKLLSDKGINLPDSKLELCGLTQQDIENLEFVVHYADMVGLSFAHRAEDIELLQEHLVRLDASYFGIVLKVETRAAFENLPALLLTLMRSPNIGVMIARGDLAVECGYERLAELQEEIMWLSEAAHLPLIWATQVLESLTKNGKPSRAEITDAAMGVRAECVMLNKGPHIIEAIQMLDDILLRMQQHQHKKRSLLRRLHW
jgi:pyruvate kinase